MLLALLLACDPVLLEADTPPPAAPTRDVSHIVPTDEADWVVDCEGGGDFETISEAIDIAADGDEIAVEPCTYEESLDFQGKTLKIVSTGGSAVTTLDAGNRSAVVATYGSGDGAALVGFTITDATDMSLAPIYVALAALRLEDVSIEGAAGYYAVLYADSADLELVDVSIDSASRPGYYGLVFVSRGAVVAENLSASCRSPSYALYVGHGSYFLDHSELDCPNGYAFANEHAVGRVHRSKLVGTVHVEAEDDHYYDPVLFENTHFQGQIQVTYGALSIRNSLLDESPISLSQVYDLRIDSSIFAHMRCAISNVFTEDTSDTSAPPQDVDIEYSNFYDVTQEDCSGTTTWSDLETNMAVDPQFVDEEGGDYRLEDGSPLIDAGRPDDIYNDPDGTPNDIGLYGGPRSMGGGW